MSSGLHAKQPAQDPWWDAEALSAPPAPTVAPAAPPRARTRREQRSVGRVLTAPLRWLVKKLLRTEQGRRIALRGLVSSGVLAVLAVAGTVIFVNNTVIARTAELGELGDRRRELRRENALLSAEAARLAAGPVVISRASRDLGMVRPAELPTFTYLFDGSRALTPLQRRRVIARNTRLAAAAERRQARAAATVPAATAVPAGRVTR